jgi:hypothetical protein
LGALKEKSKRQIPYFAKALDLNPHLTPAVYRMAMAARYAIGPKESKEWFERYRKLNPDPTESGPVPGDSVGRQYGEMGKYGNIINPFPALLAGKESEAPAPEFEPARPIEVKLAKGEHWAGPRDFTGAAAVIGRAIKRFGAGIAAFDADQDGKLDLYLTSAISGPEGLRDVLLLNKGEGRFDDGSAAFGLAKNRASIGVAAADFDADGQIDLCLTGAGGNKVLHNLGGRRFEDITSTLKGFSAPVVSIMARWVDLDQDGDLDLYIVNYCGIENAEKAFTAGKVSVPGVVNSAYRNDGEPPVESGGMPGFRAPAATAYDHPNVTRGLSITLGPWPEAEALLGGTRAHTGIAALDVDLDRDIDLVLSADGSAPVAIVNDRMGVFASGKARERRK